jgi:hypothetical protein
VGKTGQAMVDMDTLDAIAAGSHGHRRG